MTRSAAIIGGGVIGGGWAARFLLAGWNVRVFDPDPEAERKIGEVLANARASLPGLYDMPMPPEGRLSFHDTVAEAVDGVAWVQESVPERLEMKHRVYADIQAHLDPEAVIGSSTSGFKPSELQEGAKDPTQIVVTHPFNPVYLLPLAELVPGDTHDPRAVAWAKEVLTGIGMFPLLVAKEIDAHIADRFLEAVWREALWLIKDGVATTEEIDEAIRMGFGLRWAQMGLFETYRIAGGEAGMRHFIEQFGPCLSWPWTKLIDVPELTDELIDAIADQSDAQSGRYSIRELERHRDANLVGMMRSLKARDWGAGAVLNAHDKSLNATRTVAETLNDVADITQPIVTVDRAVPLDWTDYNGHMNEARYLQAFGDATDRLMLIIGCTPDYIARGGSYFTAETHIRHLDEAHAGARIRVETQLLMGAGKKMHLFHAMYEGDRLLATGEHMMIHVSLETRRASEPLPEVAEPLARLAQAHADLPKPEGAGVIGATERVAHVAECLPEICTLDCGTMNFAEADYVMTNTPGMLTAMGKMMTDLGVKPEIEAFDTGHLWYAKQLVKDGVLEPNALVQLCMGVPWGAPDDLNTFMAMVNNVPDDWTFSAFALGRNQMAYVAAAVLAGGNVRVGLEDNLMLDKGVLATNAQLVERAANIIENLGARVIGPDEVRKKLGLHKGAPK